MKQGAILFDRDGTIIVDRPGNTDPDNVELMPHAGEALALAREFGWAVGVVTNQPGIATGAIDRRTLARIHERIEQLAGPIDAWFVCTHAPQDACECRKPQPGLIVEAAQRFGIPPDRCVVVGDIGSDVEAAKAAGAQSVLVPTPITRREEIENAPVVAENILCAVRAIVKGAA